MNAKPVPLSRSGARVRVSFEFFPPKTPEMEANLWEAARRFEPLDPAFVSVTYGAGGTTRERTHATVARLVARDDDEARRAPDLRRRVEGRDPRRDARLHAAGVRHIVALRGDPPTGIDAPYEAHPEGYQTTEDLVAEAQARSAASRCRSAPIPKNTRRARRCCTTSNS